MGIPLFAPKLESDLLKPFYEGLEAGELRLTADPATGAFVWYPPDIVPGQPETVLEWRRAASEGTVYTFTRIVRSLLPGDHKAEVPFAVVLVEPDDAPGCRVPGLYTGEGDPACGQRVRLDPVKAGEHVIAGFAPIA